MAKLQSMFPASAPLPVIRPAVPNDADALALVHIQSWQAAYTHLYPADVLANLSLPGSTARWRERIEEKSRIVMVVDGKAEGEIAGFSMYGPTRDRDDDPHRTGELYALYLGPDYWGTTYATALWAEARQSLATKPYADVTVWVLPDNFRARGFYQKAGFVYEPGKDKALTLFGITLPKSGAAKRCNVRGFQFADLRHSPSSLSWLTQRRGAAFCAMRDIWPSWFGSGAGPEAR